MTTSWRFQVGLLTLATLILYPGTHDARQLSNTGLISGRVVDATTGVPIAAVSVMLSRLDVDDRPVKAGTVETGRDGGFSFANLDAGRYQVVGEHSSYPSTIWGQFRAGGPGVPIVLAAGRRLDNLTISMVSPGVISGSVLEENGEPAVGATVAALRLIWERGRAVLRDARGQPFLREPNGVKVDDRGQFRIPLLAPNDYIVVVTPVRRPADGVFAPMYYPGTTESSRSQAVTVAGGTETGGVNIRLKHLRLARVSGVVSGGDGAAGFARVTLQQLPVQPLGLDVGVYSNRSDGSFMFQNVPPGVYQLTARSAQNDADNRSAVSVASVDLSVEAQDLKDVRLDLRSGLKIDGDIDASGLQRPLPNQIRIELDPLDRPNSAAVVPPAGAPVSAKGRFSLPSVPPGRYALATRDLPDGVFVAAATFRGVDVHGLPIDVQGDGASDLRIVLTDRRTSITGQVTDAAGRRSSAATVIVFPDDQRYWAAGQAITNITQGRPLRPGRIRVQRPDSEGAFAFRDLPAGLYRVVALGRDLNSATPDTSVQGLRLLLPPSSPVALGEGEHRSVDLRITGSVHQEASLFRRLDIMAAR